jgi:hypothetical protein
MTNDDSGPGAGLRWFAERTLDRYTLERVMFPALADLEYECSDDAGASRLVRLRAYWGLWKALAVCLLTDWISYGRPAIEGVARRMLIIFPIVVGLVMVPALNGELGRPLVSTRLILLSLPQAFPVAIPVAFFFAVALEQRAKSLRRLVPAVFGMALACALVMMAVTLSMVPRANHAYAVTIHQHLKAAGKPAMVSFGPGEWTLAELVRKARSETSERDRATARQLLGMRLATSTLPIVLGFMALGIAGYERQHSLFMGVWLLIIYVAALRGAASSSYIGPSVAGVWLVNGVFCLAGLWLVWLRPSPLEDGEPKGYVIS